MTTALVRMRCQLLRFKLCRIMESSSISACGPVRFIIPLGKWRLRPHGKETETSAQRATFNAGTSAAFLPEDVVPKYLRDLPALTSSHATIRPIFERGSLITARTGASYQFRVMHVMVTTNRIKKDTDRIKNDSPQQALSLNQAVHSCTARLAFSMKKP